MRLKWLAGVLLILTAALLGGWQAECAFGEGGMQAEVRHNGRLALRLIVAAEASLPVMQTEGAATTVYLQPALVNGCFVVEVPARFFLHKWQESAIIKE